MGNKIGKWQYMGDVNRSEYGGQDFRQVSDQIWQFIDLTNMEEACGRDNEGQPKYVIEFSEVDLGKIPLKEIESALRSCGQTDLVEGKWVPRPVSRYTNEEIAYACFSYGLRAPMGSWSGGNWRKLVRSARAEALLVWRDAQRRKASLARPVNRLGSTADEYMRGDMFAAMERGVRAQIPEAALMARLHGIDKPPTVTFSTLHPDGTVSPVKEITTASINACPFVILAPEHYREDGTCMCNDRAHRAFMCKEWGYTEEDFVGIALR